MHIASRYGGRPDITQHRFFDGAAFAMEFATFVHDYGLHWEQTEIIHAENRISDRANCQAMVRLITSIQFVEPILVRSSRE